MQMCHSKVGKIYDPTVGSDGRWSTNIHITFNGNQSRFSIEGYNSADANRIIARSRLVITR